MKTILQKIIQWRNPGFHFDEAVRFSSIVQFFFLHACGVLRAVRLMIYLRNPKGMLLSPGVRFFNLRRIRWGNFLKVGRHVYISALGTEGVRFGNHVGIGSFSQIIVSTSWNEIGKFIHIGNNVGIGEYAYLGGAGGLTIGDDTIVGQYFSCHAENHRYADLHTLIRHQGVTRKGIYIGRNCWIGSKVTVLDGVTLGDGCVVAAGAVVSKSFPANSVIGGVPARIISTRNG